MVPEAGRIVEGRPLSCPLDDPLAERELVLADRLLPIPEDLPEELLPEELLPDLLPGPDCFLVLLFDFCPLLRRAVAVCFILCVLIN
jgi:hypothetical protein